MKLQYHVKIINYKDRESTLMFNSIRNRIVKLLSCIYNIWGFMNEELWASFFI